jgi:hypothetical protein
MNPICKGEIRFVTFPKKFGRSRVGHDKAMEEIGAAAQKHAPAILAAHALDRRALD